MTTRLPYPSDISDGRWALIGPTLTAWQQARIERRPTGEPARTDVREVFNALLYLGRTGCAWKYLPHDFPPHGTVYYYYAAWRDEGLFAQLNVELTGLARVKEGRASEPTAAIVDTQSVKTSTNPVRADKSSVQLSEHTVLHNDRPIDGRVEHVRLDLPTFSNMFNNALGTAATKAVPPARMNFRHAQRSYLTTARNHGIHPLDALRDAPAGHPWMPPEIA